MITTLPQGPFSNKMEEPSFVKTLYRVTSRSVLVFVLGIPMVASLVALVVVAVVGKLPNIQFALMSAGMFLKTFAIFLLLTSFINAPIGVAYGVGMTIMLRCHRIKISLISRSRLCMLGGGVALMPTLAVAAYMFNRSLVNTPKWQIDTSEALQQRVWQLLGEVGYFPVFPAIVCGAAAPLLFTKIFSQQIPSSSNGY